MLDPGTSAPFAGVRGLIDLNLSLPSSIPGILILAAFGAIAGLYFFFHGFSLLQQRARIAGRSHVQRPAHNATISSTSTFATEDSSTLKVDSHHEVIQLSSSESPQADSASMTQQGKIAAALLKAGIRNPVTLADSRVQTEVRLRERASREQPAASQRNDADVSRALQKSVSAAEIPLPSLEVRASRTPSPWEAKLMIWGGPVLTLLCIYELAARLGWL